RANRDGVLPLSFAQQRLWFLDQLEANSSVYNSPILMRLTGIVDLRALECTLTEIVRRHEVLRTRFPMQGGTPVQVIEPARWLRVPVIDLRELDEPIREAEAKRVAWAEIEEPFNLATRSAPLLRASLCRLTEDEHILLLMSHHIVGDGWSMGVLLRELV